MNTNDFSVCKVGDKLWSIELGDCEVLEIGVSWLRCKAIAKSDWTSCSYTLNGNHSRPNFHQSLFFSNPNIVAPAKKEPVYEYQWLAQSIQVPTYYDTTRHYISEKEAIEQRSGWKLIYRIEESKREVK